MTICRESLFHFPKEDTSLHSPHCPCLTFILEDPISVVNPNPSAPLLFSFCQSNSFIRYPFLSVLYPFFSAPLSPFLFPSSPPYSWELPSIKSPGSCPLFLFLLSLPFLPSFNRGHFLPVHLERGIPLLCSWGLRPVKVGFFLWSFSFSELSI